MTEHEDRPVAAGGHAVPSPHGRPLPSPNGQGQQQPPVRNADSRPDVANPYAAQQQHRPPQAQPLGNPYAGYPPQPGYQYPGYPQNYPPQPGYQYPENAQGNPPQPQTTAATGPAQVKKPLAKWWLALIAVLAVGIGAAVAAYVVKPPFLGFTKVFDHFALERTIEQQSAGRLTDVSCPAGEKAQTGVAFQCSAANGLKVDVVVKDSLGNYVWRPSH